RRYLSLCIPSFFFHPSAPTQIYTLSLHDALPISGGNIGRVAQDPNSLRGKILRLRDDGSVPPDNPFVGRAGYRPEIYTLGHRNTDRKSTRLNSSHLVISYAVFCLKKKKKKK